MNPLADRSMAGSPQPQSPAPAPSQPGVTYDQVREALHKQAAIDRELRQLLAESKGAVSRKSVVDMAIRLVADRVMSPQDMAGYLASLPTEPAQVTPWVEKHAANVENNMQKMMAMVAGQFSQGLPGAAPPSAPNAPGMQPGEVGDGQSVPDSEGFR